MSTTWLEIEDDVVQWIGVPLLYSQDEKGEFYPCDICDRMMLADELAGHWEGPAETAVWVECCVGGCEDDE